MLKLSSLISYSDLVCQKYYPIHLIHYCNSTGIFTYEMWLITSITEGGVNDTKF